MADSKIHTENSELRREKIRLRSLLSEQMREQKSLEIAGQLLQTSRWKRAQRILIYASYGAEVSTLGLIDQALLERKQVFCPRVEGKEMEFYRIFSREALKAGFKGILEPEGDARRYEIAYGVSSCCTENPLEGDDERFASKSSSDAAHEETLLIAPGTVFDLCGNRIGYGGGYYDRYLQRFLPGNRPFCIGICFACQLTEQIVPQKHDIPMDLVIYA